MKPIDPEWIKQYVDTFVKLAEKLGPGEMRNSCLVRADHALDLVEAWNIHYASDLNTEGQS